MRYVARSLIHSRAFDRDCEILFGSLAVADELLAKTVFEIAHGLATGVAISSMVDAYAVDEMCIVIVERVEHTFFLKACVAIGSEAHAA